MPSRTSAILDHLGRPFVQELSLSPPPSLPKKPDRFEQADDYAMWDRYIQHPGYALATVGVVNDAFTQAEVGYPQQQADLFEDIIERDGHLRGALEGRVDAIAGKEWVIAPGGDRPEDIEAAELLDVAMRKVENWQDTLEHQLSVNAHGWAGSEIKWEYVDGGYLGRPSLAGGAFVPTWFYNPHHRRFRFALGNDEPLIMTEASPVMGEQLRRGKWLFSRRRGRLTAISGLMRTAIWDAVIKRWAKRDWAVFSARFGLPYAIAQYEEFSDDKAKEVAKLAIQQIGSDGGAIIPKSIELKLLELVQGGGKANDVQGALISQCDMEMSKLISGATLTSSTGGPGSFALGRVHADVRFELILGDALRLAQRFTQQIGAPFVHFNGMKAAPPQLKLHVMREVDPATRAKVLSELQAMGLEIDEAQTRQEFQVKKPPPGHGLKPLAPAAGAGSKEDKNSGDAQI